MTELSHIGKFGLHTNAIADNYDAIVKLMQKVVVLEAYDRIVQHPYTDKVTFYTAISTEFRALEDGEEIPNYNIAQSDTGELYFVEVVPSRIKLADNLSLKNEIRKASKS